MRRLAIALVFAAALPALAAERTKTKITEAGQWFIPVEAFHMTNGTGLSTGVAYQPARSEGLLVLRVMVQDTDSIPGAPPTVYKPSCFLQPIVVAHPEIPQPHRVGVSIGIMIPVGRR